MLGENLFSGSVKWALLNICRWLLSRTTSRLDIERFLPQIQRESTIEKCVPYIVTNRLSFPCTGWHICRMCANRYSHAWHAQRISNNMLPEGLANRKISHKPEEWASHICARLKILVSKMTLFWTPKPPRFASNDWFSRMPWNLQRNTGA